MITYGMSENSVIFDEKKESFAVVFVRLLVFCFDDCSQLGSSSVYTYTFFTRVSPFMDRINTNR